MSNALRHSTTGRWWVVPALASLALFAACQRRTVEPGLTPAPVPLDSAAAGADMPSAAAALVPLFAGSRSYVGTTSARAYVSRVDQPAEVIDSIETLVWFRLSHPSARFSDSTDRIVLHLDSARTITRGRSRLPQQQVMHDAVSYLLVSAGTSTTIARRDEDECTAGSLASMVALQLPLPMFSATRVWTDSLRFVGCTSMIPTTGRAAVTYVPVDGSPAVVRRTFTLASEGAGTMDSVPVQLSTTSYGDGRIALQLDSLGRVLLLSLADSITTNVTFESEYGTQRFVQTVLRTTDVVAANTSDGNQSTRRSGMTRQR